MGLDMYRIARKYVWKIDVKAGEPIRYDLDPLTRDREELGRWSFDPARIERVSQLFRHPRRRAFDGARREGNQETHRERNRVGGSFRGHCQESGFLSARNLDFLVLRNMGAFGNEVIRDLVRSLPISPSR